MRPILARVPFNVESIILFCALLGIVWAYFLFNHKRGNLSANKYLGLLILSLAVLILRQATTINKSELIQHFLYFISQGTVYLVGPAIYFHIKQLTGGKTGFSQIWKHFIPAVLTFVLMTFLFSKRLEIKEINNLLILKIASITFIGLQIIHLFVYVIFSKKLVKAYETGLTRYYSSMSKINLAWIKQLIWITSIFAALILGMYLLILTGGYYHINNTADLLFLLLIAILILSIIIKSWQQPEIVSGIYEEQIKYKTSPLTAPEVKQLKMRLENLIKQDKIFLIQELNLHQLAIQMKVQPYIVSQLINQEYQQSFFNFINDFRIEFALESIGKGALKHTTLVGIAYESGFNSKSTFNRAFRKKMGCAPKEYVNSLIKGKD